MADNTEYEIEIYHAGVVIKLVCPGKDRYLQEKGFLNKIMAKQFDFPETSPDANEDFYVLNDEQLDAYYEFRKQLREQQDLGCG